MTTTTYPNGQQLVSSALTVAAINAILLPLTCGMIGINPPDFSLVRINWQVQGQPFEDEPDNVCYLSCVPTDVQYSKIRDRSTSQSDPGVTETWTYTKGWRISWIFYGPNAEDRARMVKSAMFIDYFTDRLNLANLFPVSDFPEVTRIPEKINAQWWERADFHVDMYEGVTETILYGPVTSIEVKLADNSGPLADFTQE